MNQIEAYWQAFLEESGKPLSCRYSYCDHFGDNETSAAILLELVLNGKKRATSSCMNAFVLQNEKVPAVGDYSIVTDWNGTPRCIIQTTHLTVIPFCEMTFDVCRREGEDDCLETWREIISLSIRKKAPGWDMYFMTAASSCSRILRWFTAGKACD